MLTSEGLFFIRNIVLNPDYLRDKQQFIDRLVATGKYTHPDAQGEKKARSTTSPRPLRERFQKLAGIKKKKK